MADENTPAPAQEAAPAQAAPSVEDILSFDPFGPSEGDKSGSTPAPVETKPAAEGGDGVPQDQPPEPKPAEAPPKVEDPELAALKAQLAEATKQIESLRQPPAAAQQEPEKKDETPAYNYSVPDALVEKLNSEDPRDQREGLAALMSGTSRVVHKTVMDSVQQLLQAVGPQIMNATITHLTQVAQSQQSQTAIRNDFYGTYKEFDTPERRPIVQALAASLAQEMKVTEYSEGFKKALAERVKLALGGVTPAAPATPPAITGGSGARMSPSPATQMSNEIMELF